MPSRGRPRLFGAERTPSGRTMAGTRAGDRLRGQEAQAASVRTRARHTGLSEQEAADRYAGSPEGVLVLRGMFSDAQADAVRLYRRCWERYLETVPGPSLATAGIEKRRGRSVDVENPVETERARRNYATAQAALKSAGRSAVAAVTTMVERHAPPPVEDWPAARRRADALAVHFRLEEREQFEELW